MTPEQKAAYVIAMAANLMGEVAGMQAENKQREHRGEGMAYYESDFLAAIDRANIRPEDVQKLFQN